MNESRRQARTFSPAPGFGAAATKRRLAVALLCLCLQACDRPCRSPIHYRIGTIDPGFGISEGQLLSILRRAEEVWESSAHRDLFRYASDGELVINLVYDHRQRTAQDNARQLFTIEKSGGLADAAKAELESARTRYESARRSFDAAQAEHEKRVTAHNLAVEAWNARGGAPEAQYSAIRQEEAGIHSSASALEARLSAVNALAEHANKVATRYNELATEVNESVASLNQTAGQEFRQGHYTRDSEGERIDVFEYTDRTDLQHVLAHELGHALGLDHNANPQSILYGINSSHTLELSPEDIAALKIACRF